MTISWCSQMSKLTPCIVIFKTENSYGVLTSDKTAQTDTGNLHTVVLCYVTPGDVQKLSIKVLALMSGIHWGLLHSGCWLVVRTHPEGLRPAISTQVSVFSLCLSKCQDGLQVPRCYRKLLKHPSRFKFIKMYPLTVVTTTLLT
jgi:hypothetical protein